MDTVKLRTDIEHAIECLYQNREQDGLEAVRNLLPQFQEMIQESMQGQTVRVRWNFWKC